MQHAFPFFYFHWHNGAFFHFQKRCKTDIFAAQKFFLNVKQTKYKGEGDANPLQCRDDG